MELIEIKEEHYPQVASIYAEGIATGQATFELSEDRGKSQRPTDWLGCTL